MIFVRVILVFQALQAHLDFREHQEHQDSLVKEGKQVNREIQDLQGRGLVLILDIKGYGDLDNSLGLGHVLVLKKLTFYCTGYSIASKLYC